MKRSSRILAVIGFCARAAYADRGSIPFVPNVRIFEPNQRAMIAWNGEEEMLLLSTDLRASARTKVLEVLPLPSEPEVKKGEIEAFRKAVRIINSRIVRAYRAVLGKGRSRSELYRPAQNVRRRTREARGGASPNVRLALRKPTLRGVGGVLLLLSPFIDGRRTSGGGRSWPESSGSRRSDVRPFHGYADGIFKAKSIFARLFPNP